LGTTCLFASGALLANTENVTAALSPAVDLATPAMAVVLGGFLLQTRFSRRLAMSRTVSRTRNLVPPPPPSSRQRWDWQRFPPWLASFVCHWSLLLILALMLRHSAEPVASEMFVEWQDAGEIDAGGGGEPADLGDPTAPPSELASITAPLPEPLEANADAAVLSEFGAVSDALDPVAPLTDLSGLLDGTLGDGLGGSGGGSGGGHGRGHGSGVGDGSGPGVARTSMFGLVGEGSSFVYVFDRSESMNSVFTLNSEGRSVSITPLEAAKVELMQSLDNLGPANKFQLIFYNDEPLLYTDHYSAGGVYAATDDAKALAKAFIEELPGQGNTFHLAALELALRSKPDVLFLLTDAEAKDDPPSSQIKRLIKMCRRNGTRVNVIHFAYAPRTQNPLNALAKATGGEHVSISIRSLVRPDW